MSSFINLMHMKQYPLNTHLIQSQLTWMGIDSIKEYHCG